ncbi:barnase inhibitor [Kitasatospora sp. NPDC002227]|uniref:barstar family protein n=1 Tax=Kitasatospora sp. NPDC002227 TaxID=3154773 RepID=UPI003316F34E
MVDAAGAPLAYYYVGSAEIRSVLPSETVDGTTDVLTSFFGYTLPYPGAREIWPRWASGVPIQRGEWRAYPPELYGSWLHVAQQAWFSSGRRARRYGDEREYLLDGSHMINIAGFYCALGESVNGPGGYCGSNPSALEDCLISTPQDVAPLRLVWQNFRVAEQSLDPDELGYALEVLRHNGVDLVLD